MKILLVDNYDSFTFNLVHYLEALDCEVTVLRNDELHIEQADRFDKFVLSPGPGLPTESNQLNALIEVYKTQKPILGVCLGFQALVESFSGRLFNQKEVKHGIQENCSFDPHAELFKGLPETFKVGLYHSWAAHPESFPTSFKITAQSENGIIMAFEHDFLPLCGVQFHPESVLTEHGSSIVNNFICNFH
ncbi:MAG: aminodeoxychorismate/anthranilate synthase component II [Crocinitomicaceae bacterium]